MSTTRFTSGGATITVTADYAAIIRRAVSNASGGILDALETAANEVRAEAQKAWYDPKQGVTKDTGRSGDIEVITEVSETRVKVWVGSTDTKNAIFVHRPGALSLTVEEISKEDYSAQKKTAQKKMVFHARRSDLRDGIVAGQYYRNVPNPLASNGRYLVSLLVASPMRARVKAIKPLVAAAIARRRAR